MRKESTVALVPIEKLRASKELELKETLDHLARILRTGGVEKPVITDQELNVIENLEVFEALKKLGAKLVPVATGAMKTFVPLEQLGIYDDISPDPLRVYGNTLELLYRGWPTPLVFLRSLSSNGRRVWAKLEGFNPYSWSIKDRIGWYMFTKALEKQGIISKKIIYEATSTNTGIALAAMAAIHGFTAKFYIPSSLQKASDTLLRVMGAEVVRVPKTLTVEFVDDVDKAAKEEGALHLNQFENDYNFEVHLKYTVKELELQLRHAKINPAAIIGGIGTSGHMSAIAFYLRNRWRGNLGIYCVQPKPEHVIPGIRRIESGMKWIHWIPIDGVIDVGKEEAIKEAIEIARKEGILIGLSSGAVVAGFKKLITEHGVDKGDFVLIFPDHGFKYVEQFSDYLSSAEHNK